MQARIDRQLASSHLDMFLCRDSCRISIENQLLDSGVSGSYLDIKNSEPVYLAVRQMDKLYCSRTGTRRLPVSLMRSYRSDLWGLNELYCQTRCLTARGQDRGSSLCNLRVGMVRRSKKAQVVLSASIFKHELQIALIIQILQGCSGMVSCQHPSRVQALPLQSCQTAHCLHRQVEVDMAY